jgi:hypothetical protein
MKEEKTSEVKKRLKQKGKRDGMTSVNKIRHEGMKEGTKTERKKNRE